MAFRERFYPAILGFFTFFTSFWRVLKVLVDEKALFARGPNKVLAAIHTAYGSVC
jgi:hypothetical protein